MDTGLTFKQIKSIKLLKDDQTESTTVAERNYTFSANTQDYTFTIAFSKEFTDTLVAGDKIIVEYEAILNENALIYNEYNKNETLLKYGDTTDNSNETNHDITKTYTYSFDLVKTDTSNVVLTGAKFRLYTALTGGTEIKVVWDANKHAYRVAKAVESGVEIEVTADKLTNGKIVIIGLDSDTYYLDETQAPDGYNKLTSRVEVKIEGANLSATMANDTTWSAGGVHVINYTGAELPTTGGMGTILFITIGSLIVIGAGVLLVTKLRISKMNA